MKQLTKNTFVSPMRKLLSSSLILLFMFLISSGKKEKAFFPQEQNVLQKIEFTDPSLNFFKSKIDSLKKGLISKVRIVHIGDSHIQADFFSGETRNILQDSFGNGGRGLVFPYEIAKTNGPRDYCSSSASAMENQKNISYPHKFSSGISGISLRSTDTQGGVEFFCPADTLQIDFHSAKIFYSCKPETEISCNSKKYSFKKPGNMHSRFDTINFCFSSAQKKCFIEWKGNKEFLLHGIVLENGNKGITYSAIGVNGARFHDYNKSELFFEQLELMNADLVVVSLGTNDSYNSKYTNEEFEKQMNLFIVNLKMACPLASVIFTAPSENFHYNRKTKKASENKNVGVARDLMKQKCLQKNIAWWDLYEAMGGKGSMKQWKSEGLAAYDYVHFSRKGYKLQGKMFAEALLEAVTN